MYRKRLLEHKLEENLNTFGAVVVVGPKFCGKTCLANQYANSSFYFIDQESINQFLLNKNIILDGSKPRLIDEWQICPEVWDNVRRMVDQKRVNEGNGLYILTGSSSPINKKQIFHSGIGRISKLELSTFTIAEILDLNKNNSYSLSELFNKYPDNLNLHGEDVNKLNQIMINGGWPVLYDGDNNGVISNMIANNYISSYMGIDGEKLYNLRISPRTFMLICKSIARRVGTQLNITSIMKDIRESITRPTLQKYIDVLYGTHVIFDITAWNSDNIRSSYRITTKPKTYFCDTSLICSLLDVSNTNELVNDMNTLGFVFENQVMKDLNVYAQVIGANLYFYRDEKGNEIDAIIKMPNGEWAAIEIKLSFESAINSIKKMNHAISTLNMNGNHKEPKFKMIITCSPQLGISEKDGVIIMPHSLLRP